MDSESLTQIVDLLKTLGNGAQWAFFVWIGYGVFKVLATIGGILTLAWWIIRALVKANSDERTLRAIANIVDRRYYEPDSIIGAVAVLKSKCKE